MDAGKVLAAAYVWGAQDFVQTEVRKAVQIEPWFPAPLPEKRG